MKIIKEGRLVEDEEFEAHCPKCKTVFSFFRKEAKSCSDQRDGRYLEVRCPLPGCGDLIYVDLR